MNRVCRTCKHLSKFHPSNQVLWWPSLCGYQVTPFVRNFSAPTSQSQNPNINQPSENKLPQNIQNIIDKNESQGHTTVPNSSSSSSTASTTAASQNKNKSDFSGVIDANSILPKQRQEQIAKAFDYCLELVKTDEPQIYQCMQHVKCTDTQRLGMMVLRALHLELSRVRSDANTADAAKIRLHWWISAMKDVINDKHLKNTVNPNSNKNKKQKIGKINPNANQNDTKESNNNNNENDKTNNPKLAMFKDSVSLAPQTPVLTALSIVRRKYNLSPNWLLKFVESREHFLGSNAFPSLLELEEYSENTHGILFNLCFEILDTAYTSSAKLNHKVATHIACFMTIASVLRSMPFAVRNGFIAIPDDICGDYRVWENEDTILKGQSSKPLEKAVTFMCERAYAHLLEARDVSDKLTIPVKSLFLVALPAERYLQRLENSNFNVFDPKLLKPDLGISFKGTLAWRAAKNSF